MAYADNIVMYEIIHTLFLHGNNNLVRRVG